MLLREKLVIVLAQRVPPSCSALSPVSEGDHEHAVRFAREALAAAEEVGSQIWIAYCLQRLGIEHHGRGEHAQAKHLFTEALVRFQAEGDRSGEAMALQNLGAIRETWGSSTRR